MPFLVPVNRTKNSKSYATQIIITGIFIGLSYMLSLLPLALFAIAQTLAIFGTRIAMLLSLSVVLCLCIFAFTTGISVFALGAFFAIVTTPIFLIVAILRKKNTSIFWSAAILGIPLILFFSGVLSAPTLTKNEYSFEIEKIETAVLSRQQSISATSDANQDVYNKVKEQFEFVKRDVSLQNFMSWNLNQRIIYFIYGPGFPILFGILLSFFASLFFLDFAFEQIEKLQAVATYIGSVTRGAFDRYFLEIFKVLQRSKNTNAFKELSFKVIKHKKRDIGISSNKSFIETLRNKQKSQNDTNTISLREYVFYYVGELPGWSLRTYQIPLILCILSIMVFAGTVFYFGNFQNILTALTRGNNAVLALGVALSVIAVCVLSFLVLQGIFTALKWIPFGLLLFISIVFLIVAPYIMVSVGPYIFLGVFGIIGLLGYLK